MKATIGKATNRTADVALGKAVGLLSGSGSQRETSWYSAKRRRRPPMVNESLGEQRLSNVLALGVLSSDCISSSAYGSEEILFVLLPTFGLAAYGLLLPMTGVVLAVLVLVTLSYRSVVMVYTHAGGSYVVARENFGPVVAQVGAVALMIDYIVTVAVQAAAGTAAVTSAVRSPEPPRHPAGHHGGRRPSVVLRQPSRFAGGRPHVRLPDLLLRRVDAARHHRRRDPGDLRRPAALRHACPRRGADRHRPQRPHGIGDLRAPQVVRQRRARR